MCTCTWRPNDDQYAIYILCILSCFNNTKSYCISARAVSVRLKSIVRHLIEDTIVCYCENLQTCYKVVVLAAVIEMAKRQIFPVAEIAKAVSGAVTSVLSKFNDDEDSSDDFVESRSKKAEERFGRVSCYPLQLLKESYVFTESNILTFPLMLTKRNDNHRIRSSMIIKHNN